MLELCDAEAVNGNEIYEENMTVSEVLLIDCVIKEIYLQFQNTI